MPQPDEKRVKELMKGQKPEEKSDASGKKHKNTELPSADVEHKKEVAEQHRK